MKVDSLTPPFCKEAERFFKERAYDTDEEGRICNPRPRECFLASDWPRILVISMFDGIGGAFEALNALPAVVEGWAAEVAAVQRRFVSKKWPMINTMEGARDITEEWISDNPDLRDPSISAVLLLGGAPCGPFSSLGAQRGFDEGTTRSRLVHTFRKARDALAKRCEQVDKPFRWLFEETSTMTVPERRQFSDIFGQVPVAIHSADFGHVHRLRLWWGLSAHLPRTLPWGEVHPPKTLAPDAFVLRLRGAPLPQQWQPSDPTLRSFRDASPPTEVFLNGICGTFGPKLPGSTCRPTYTEGRFLTMTGCWPGHPVDTTAAR